MKSKYIVGLGATVMDYTQVVEQFPKIDTKTRSISAQIACGGSAVNALVAMSHLGLRTFAVGIVGQDAFGKMIVADLKKHNINTSLIQKSAQHESSVSTVIVAQNTRTIIGHYALEHSLDLSKIKTSFWNNVGLLHLDGHHIKAAISAAKKVHVAGGLVSLDGGHASPDIDALLPYADIMIMSETFILEHAKQKDIAEHMFRLQKQFNPKVLVITRGQKGVWYCEDNQVKKLAAFKVRAQDTTGAGDVFHGGFLTAYLKGYSIAEAIQFGQATAALKVQHIGTHNGMPSFNQVKRFLSLNS